MKRKLINATMQNTGCKINSIIIVEINASLSQKEGESSASKIQFL